MKNSKAIFFAVLAAVLYAINSPVSKLLLENVPAKMMAGFLYLGAGIGIFLLGVVQKLTGTKQDEQPLTKKELPYTIAMVVLDIAVSEEQYQAIERRIQTMLTLKHHYRYNYLGLWLAGLRICYRRKRTFYCSEFVKDILAKQDIHGVRQLDAIVQPIHFLSLPTAQQIYTGLLQDYRFVRPAFR